MKSLLPLRLMVTTVLVLAVTGCNRGGNGQGPAAPQTPAGSAVQTTTTTGPSAPSTTATSPTSSGVKVATATGEKPVALTGSDGSSAAQKDPKTAIGAGLVAQLKLQEVNTFRQSIWKAVSDKYAKRANTWALDTDTDPQQVQFLKWGGANPTVVITKGQEVVERLERPTQAQIEAALERWLSS
ncbi:MAG: hypothetical protein HY816_13305 [Candidatus Wallbacteria bacterium]|nr:hypothetical protein [Candidatus Wallbacteria bacterium]